MKYPNYRKLDVWNRSILICKEIYKITSSFPKSETFGISGQMRRCSVSVASNIAEGSKRNTDNEFKHFVGMARGSLAELDTQLVISKELNYLNPQDFDKIFNEIIIVGKMLTNLHKSLNKY